MNLIEAIIAMFSGQKYWANIINTRGTDRCELSCFIFTTKEDADKHRRDLETNASFMYIETVSFRSRKQYPKVNR
jgi:hypothetical protein